MNKLTKLMLATAVLATSGFAAGTTIGEDTIIKSGWEITKSDAASIAEGVSVTMQGDNSAASNLVISGSGSLSNEGTVELHDASSIIVSSSATAPFSNIGVVDLSNVTDFSSFVVNILNSNNAKIVVPAPNDSVTAGGSTDFIFTAPSGDSESFIIEYAGGTYKLEISGTNLVISGTAGGTYADLAAVKTKLGVAVDDDAKATLQSTESPISLLDVINDTLNQSSNNDKTFDLAQTGLSSREAALTADKTIHFGFVGAVGNDMKLTGKHKATFAGDNSGMLSKIATEGDAVFSGKAPKGALEIAGNLLMDHSGEAQTLAGEIKAGSVTIPSGTKVTFSSKLTTGWSALLTAFVMPEFDVKVGKACCYKIDERNYVGVLVSEWVPFEMLRMEPYGDSLRGTSGGFLIANEFSNISCDVTSGTLDFGGMLRGTDALTTSSTGVNYVHGTWTWDNVYDALVNIAEGNYEFYGYVSPGS